MHSVPLLGHPLVTKRESFATLRLGSAAEMASELRAVNTRAAPGPAALAPRPAPAAPAYPPPFYPPQASYPPPGGSAPYQTTAPLSLVP